MSLANVGAVVERGRRSKKEDEEGEEKEEPVRTARERRETGVMRRDIVVFVEFGI